MLKALGATDALPRSSSDRFQVYDTDEISRIDANLSENRSGH